MSNSVVTSQEETIFTNIVISQDETIHDEKVLNDAKEVNPVNKITSEDYIANRFKSKWDLLNPSLPVEEQIEKFIEEIGFSKEDIMVKEAFLVAKDSSKITYNNVVFLISKRHPEMEEEKIMRLLKKSLKEWTEKYPEIKKMFPKFSMNAFWKVFAYKMKKD